MTALWNVLRRPAATTDHIEEPPSAINGGVWSWASVSRYVTTSVVLAGAVLLLILLAAVWPQSLAPYDPYTENTQAVLAAPSPSHWFGTDYLGRDVLSRVIHGAGVSVVSALLAVLIGAVLGSGIGLIAGHYAGKPIESLLMRIVDVLIAIPGLLLSMTIVVALGFSSINAAIAVGISSSAAFARLGRSEVLRIKKAPYLEAARLIGARGWALILPHIVPNAWSSILALSILQFGSAILSIASLAFLGYGDPPPSPEWGALVAEGQNYIFSAPWLVLLPSATIVLAVLVFNRLSTFIKEVSVND